MRRIILSDNTISSEQKIILQEQYKFYKRLSNPRVKFALLNNSEENKVSDKDKKELNQPITIEELHKSLLSLASNKTPGCDGLPPEWYRVFWEQIKIELFEAYKYAIKIGRLHLSGRRGVICLIPKKDRDPLIVKN